MLFPSSSFLQGCSDLLIQNRSCTMGMHKSLVKLVDPTDPVFRELHNFTECRYQKFHGEGIGATQRQAESISKEEEQGLFGALHYKLTLY